MRFTSFRVIPAGQRLPTIGRALWDAKPGEPLFVELGDGKTPGPLERTRDEIRALPER